MKTRKITLRTLALVLFCSFMAVGLSAQSKKEKRMKAATDALSQTEFIETFEGYTESIENQISEFKRDELSYDERDVDMVKKAYGKTQKKFDYILDNIKSDFLDRKTRDYMVESPERYTRLIKLELEEAMDYYRSNCEERIMDLQGMDDFDFGFGVAEISLLIGLFSEVSSAIKDIQKAMNEMSEAYIEENLIGDLRLEEWDEI